MASQQTFLSTKEEKLLSLLQTGCSAYSTNPEDAEVLRSLRDKGLILIWQSANWSQNSFNVSYSGYGAYPKYVETDDCEGFKLI